MCKMAFFLKASSGLTHFSRLFLPSCLGILLWCGLCSQSLALDMDFYATFMEKQAQHMNAMMQQSLQDTLDEVGSQGQVTLNQEAVDKALDWYSIPEVEAMGALQKFSIKDLTFFYLKPMFRVKRPSLNATNLSQEEQNFCLLVQAQLIEDLSNINPQCLDMSNYVQNVYVSFRQYSTLLSVLELFRIRYELGLSEAELKEILNREQVLSEAQQSLKTIYQMPAKPLGSTLNMTETGACFDMIMHREMLLEGIKVGYPISSANNLLDLYQQKCTGRIVPIRKFLKSIFNDNLALRILPLASEVIYSAYEHIKPDTYLFPFSGTEQQRQPEVIEAQKYLKQLGYLYNQPTGVVDYATTNAIMEFERDLGLVQTGVLSFSTLMRLRLFTVGYKPQYLL